MANSCDFLRVFKRPCTFQSPHQNQTDSGCLVEQGVPKHPYILRKHVLSLLSPVHFEIYCHFHTCSHRTRWCDDIGASVETDFHCPGSYWKLKNRKHEQRASFMTKSYAAKSNIFCMYFDWCLHPRNKSGANSGRLSKVEQIRSVDGFEGVGEVVVIMVQSDDNVHGSSSILPWSKGEFIRSLGKWDTKMFTFGILCWLPKHGMETRIVRR